MDSASIVDVITCGVCLETFDEAFKCPRILSCGHSFCQSCLEKMLCQSRSCPTCRGEILFTRTESIPVNFSLKSLINIRCQVPMTNALSNLNLQSDAGESFSSVGEQGTTSRKHLSEGFCSEHNHFKELRCMDCDIWICGMCATLQHKHCRTIVVEEAYKELKKQVTKKVESELVERKMVSDGLDVSLRVLNEERKYLIEKAKDRAKRIEELESLKSEEIKFCGQLKQLQTLVESSFNDTEFSTTINNLDKLLEEGKKQIPKHLQNLDLPQRYEVLRTLCQNGPVYAVEDLHDGIRYGKVAVKDGRIWVHHFQPEKPAEARLFIFTDLLSLFGKSTEFPRTGFIQLCAKGGSGSEVIEVVIETDGHTKRANNFILLCSALKGFSYQGFSMMWRGSFDCYHLYQGPPPVVEGIRNDDPKTVAKEAVAYGMWENNSWFAVQLKDNTSSSFKFGVVVTGLQSLKDRQGKDCSVTGCGLVI